MAQYSKTMIASSVAVAIGLSGCGGGGTSMASIPPPPAAPTPTPTPTPTAASISAPARAIAPNANLFPQAAPGGPTIQSHSSTVFPLLETVVSITPGTVTAGTSTMNAGATLASTAPTTTYNLDVGNPALGVANAVLSPSPSATVFRADVGGGATAFLDISNPATSNLSWTSYGFWDVHASASYTESPFVTGYATPAAAVPTSGIATYRGSVIGEAFHPDPMGIDGTDFYQLTGDASLQANFASGTIVGSMNMSTKSFEGEIFPWNSVSLLGSIAAGQFSGTSTVTSAPANSASLSAAATGTFAGMFFGPNAQELGAVWTLYDGTSSAIGSIGAKNDPACSGCWDY